MYLPFRRPFETKNAKKKQLKRKNRAKGREDKPKKIESKESSKSKQIDLEKPDVISISFLLTFPVFQNFVL